MNDFLVRNKNGDPVLISQSLGPAPRNPASNPFGGNLDFNSGKVSDPKFGVSNHANFNSGALDPGFDDDFQLERQAMEERKLDLARELEEESRRRAQAEDDLERIKEEFLRKEIEDSR